MPKVVKSFIIPSKENISKVSDDKHKAELMESIKLEKLVSMP